MKKQKKDSVDGANKKKNLPTQKAVVKRSAQGSAKPAQIIKPGHIEYPDIE
jgi:hypothetical protein